jgi:pimeloyl-ACP methyl ester carboxylesterase
MKCPPDTPPDAGAQDQPPPPEALLAQELRWAQACRDQLAGAGFDLTAYNSMAHASDLNDLRQALGYARWNLYGTSYGTRTALVTMQAVPEGIRSAVLDSVLPPQVDFIGRGDAAAAAGSLSALFAACKADAACNRDYPDLETKLGEVVRRLDANPAKVKAPEGDTGKTRQVWIAGANVLAGIRAAMMQPVLIQILPLAITRLHAGDPSVIERLYGALLSGDNPAVQNTVLCHDTGALFDAQAYHQELARLPLLASSRAGDQQAAVCQAWGAGRADPAESQPVRSDIPTLLLSGGGYDAGPAEGARLAASTLSRSFRYEFPAYSHYVTLNECPQAMMAAFLDDPSRAPDASCAAGIKALPFVTDVYLNPGVFRVASDVQFEPKAWIRVALALCGLLFLAAVIGAPILWLRSRRGAGGGARRGMAWLVLWLGALCSLAFGAGVWLLLRKAMAETYGWVTLFGFSPASSRYLFLLPWLAAVLAIAAIVFAVTAAVRGWWSRGVWIAYTAVTAAVLGFSALLVYWRLLGAVGFAY